MILCISWGFRSKPLEAGANLNVLDSNDCSALHLAVDEGEIESVRLLLDFRADTNLETSEGKTVVHIAAENPGCQKSLFCFKGLFKEFRELLRSLGSFGSNQKTLEPFPDFCSKGMMSLRFCNCCWRLGQTRTSSPQAIWNQLCTSLQTMAMWKLLSYCLRRESTRTFLSRRLDLTC